MLTRALPYEHFPHDADVGVRGFGDTPEEAFEHAALAMIAVIADPASVGGDRVVEVECEAPDRELLLVDWLNALVYEMDARRMIFGRFEVSIAGDQLRARAFGESVDRLRHRPVVGVKGATLTELRVARDEEGRWLAQCVVDV